VNLVQKWKTIVLYVVALVALAAVSFVYSRKLGEQLLAQAEIDELEQIPVAEEV
jgi:hypothetical protein